MDTNELRARILEEAKHRGITLTEDELNAKVLEASQMDPEKIERLSGGKYVFNCDESLFCWSDFMCVTWSKGKDDCTKEMYCAGVYGAGGL